MRAWAGRCTPGVAALWTSSKGRLLHSLRFRNQLSQPNALTQLFEHHHSPAHPPPSCNMAPERSSSTGTSQPPAAKASTSAAPYQPIYAQRQPIRRSQKACKYCRKSKGNPLLPSPPRSEQELTPLPRLARCDGPESWPCRRCRESGVVCEFENMDQAELQQHIQAIQHKEDTTPGRDSRQA